MDWIAHGKVRLLVSYSDTEVDFRHVEGGGVSLNGRRWWLMSKDGPVGVLDVVDGISQRGEISCTLHATTESSCSPNPVASVITMSQPGLAGDQRLPISPPGRPRMRRCRIVAPFTLVKSQIDLAFIIQCLITDVEEPDLIKVEARLLCTYQRPDYTCTLSQQAMDQSALLKMSWILQPSIQNSRAVTPRRQ